MNEHSAPATERRHDFGKLQHGCEHYKRRCKIRAPCCNQIFSCRHCHNESMSSSSNSRDVHELVRRDVKQVICSICDTEQEVAKVCFNCGINMGEYYCEICKFYDDDTDKGQFHCDECGICRVGGRDKFFHCTKCGSCYSVSLQNNHSCVENSMKSSCPVCFEKETEILLKGSLKRVRVDLEGQTTLLSYHHEFSTILRCGHTMHTECYQEMATQNQYRCPICLKTIFDMSQNWEHLDREIEAAPMPRECNFEVSILCNDCNATSTVSFHIFGHKCRQCSSYNTRRISTPAQQ